MRTLIRSVVLACGVFAACAVSAAVLDLNGSDTTETSLAGYTAVQNSGAQATLTVNLTADETFAGTISGPVKLVKTGAKMLTLSGVNTYTGGTEINGGKLIAGSTTAFGNPTDNAAVQVNSDCTTSSASDANVTAVGIAVTSFGYNLNFSDWSDHKGRPTTNGQDGYQAMYNVWVSVANVTMSGKLTGGDVAIRQAGNSWGSIDKVAGLTISGDVDLSGTFYVVNRAQGCTVSGQMKVGAIKLSHDTTPSVLTLSHVANEIGELDVGRYWSGGGVTCKVKNAIGGAKVYTTTGDIGATAFVDMGSRDQAIDCAYMTRDTKGKDYGGSADGLKHYFISSSAATLTMNASTSVTNDWMFRGAMSLVWNPQGDYAITNVYRAHLMTGSVEVKCGGFVVLGSDCSFNNITGFTAADDTTVALLDGGTLRSDGVLDVSVGSNTKLVISEGTTWTVKSLKVGSNGDFAAIGTYTSGRTICQNVTLEGGGTLVVMTRPAVGKTVTWVGGAEGCGISAAANWKNASLPTFDGGCDVLQFAESGTEADIDQDAMVKSVEFIAQGGFTVKGDKTLSLISDQAITTPYFDAADNAPTYKIAAPLVVGASQTWTVNSNAVLRITGPLNWSGLGPQPTLTLKGNGNVRIVANANSTFSGPVVYGETAIPNVDKFECPYLWLQGISPIGTGRLSITGLGSGKNDWGHYPMLYLDNADISNPIYLHGHYSTIIQAVSDSTNHVRGVINTDGVDFAPFFYVGKNAQLVLGAASNLASSPNAYDGNKWTVRSMATGKPDYETSSLVLNGAITYKFAMTYDSAFGDTYFNAPSNDIAGIVAAYSGNFHCGADYAFANGKTSLKLASANGASAVFDLHGHPQDVGTLHDGAAANVIQSSGVPAVLSVNQTEDHTYKGMVGAGVELVKKGPAKLGFSNAAAFVGARDGTVLTLAEGTVSFPAAGVKVFQLKYVDENGESHFAKPGRYTKETAPDEIKGFFADDSGSISVRQGELPNGLQIFFRAN